MLGVEMLELHPPAGVSSGSFGRTEALV